MTAPMLLDSEQAAELLNVSTRTLREFVKTTSAPAPTPSTSPTALHQSRTRK